MNFLRMQKECFRLRGELQNDSISGVSTDERQLIKDNLNKEQRNIARLSPPMMKDEWHIKLRNSVALQNTAGTNTATATEGIPRVIDTSSNLDTSHKFWLLTDGTHRYRVINTTGITVSLDYGSVANTSTTSTGWVAYKDSYAIPHNMGRIIDVFLEDGDRPLEPLSGAGFDIRSRRVQQTGASPTVYAQDTFTNRWEANKFSITAAKGHTGITAANGELTMQVGTTQAGLLDWGDNLLVDTATTDEYLHTVSGIDTTNGLLYLDRPYTGSDGIVTIYVNPVEHTRYMTFFMIPDTEKDVVISAYVKAQNMVLDTDECLYEEDMCWTIIYGALRKDSLGRSFLNEQQEAQYQEALRNLKRTPYANITQSGRRENGTLGGAYTFRQGEIQ